jgi:hypothetical protein
MTVFLFLMASVAVLAGLVSLLAGHRPRMARRLQTLRALMAPWSLGCGQR